MDLIDRLQELATRCQKVADQLQTEEATKNAMVMPFINALGYNVFDPTEVVPEFTADVGVKKGEKVDYAIMRDNKPILLFECKTLRTDLDKEHASQLYRYFSVTEARFGVLTNGRTYRFYSDLEAPNKMDDRPFFEFDLFEVTEDIAEQLKQFMRDSFDVESILSSASDLKYLRGVKRILVEEWANPSEDLVRLLAARVYSGRLTQGMKDLFAQIVKKAMHEFIGDRVNRRLQTALERGNAMVDLMPDPTPPENDEGTVVTTEDELEAFYIVKAIVREVVDGNRVFMRDTQSYCGILLDDNNRKPICRLIFNNPTRKYLGLLDGDKNLDRRPIAELDDIYHFAGELKESVRRYLGREKAVGEANSFSEDT